MTLGFGRLFSNDYLGDGSDRWRTGSYVVSWLRGPVGTESRGNFGEVLEYRFGTAVLAPASLTAPAADDRRYAGVLSVGLHSQFNRGALELSTGVDLVMVGPQTGISDFQEETHELFGATVPSPAVVANQIPDRVMPTTLVEAARPFALSPTTSLRPFVEVQAGAETFVRVGGDVLIGAGFTQGLVMRDGTTGMLYQGARDLRGTGLSFLVGADVARVAHSAYLPTSDGYALTDVRARARAGVQYRGERYGAFYGVTWLGEEFEAQPTGQVLGSINIQLNF
nr:lipid A-modifier LpxR family protein [Aliiroseovarius sp.]